MLSRRTILSLAAAFVSQVAVAQEPTAPAAEPAAPPPAAQPAAPAEETVTAPDAPEAAAAPREQTEEIIVTGTRIRRKDLTTPAPVTVINREAITSSGKVSIGDFLQALPEQGNAINTTVNNGGEGSTRVNLRGLGEERTLVLLNGRRFVPGGTGADDSVDLNSIPSAAIERIEVLKDGASAIYGSDAIGGVVNLITRKGWSGTEFGAYTGTTSRGDANTYDLSFTTGISSDRGNFMFSGGYFNQGTAWAGDRNFSKIPVAFDAIDGVYTIGSGTIPNGRVVLDAGEIGQANGNALWNALVAANPEAGSFIRDPSAGGATDLSGWRPYRGSGLSFEGGDGYNFQPDNYLVTPSQRIQLFAIGDTAFGEVARGYFEASYVNRQSDQLLAAEPLLTDQESVTVSANNLYNPFGRDFTAIRRRLLEFGGRASEQDIDTFRVVGGVDGTLADWSGPLSGWFWDLSFNYGRTQGVEVKNGNLRLPRLQDAVGASMLDPVTNEPICVRTAGDASTAIPGCVPLNLFGGAGTITPDMVSGLTYTGTQRGFNQLSAVQANVSGELFKLLSDRPIGLALGYEYRELSGAQIPDPITNAGETSGNKLEITRGSYNVHEGYAELSIPIVSGMRFAEDLEATLAGRVFDYSTFGSDFTYKLGGRWRVIPDFTVRGTFSTAFRAPSISDLFLGQADDFAPVSDPCAAPSTNPALVASCGAALGNGDDQTQLRSRVGGNPTLEPETADIFTVGLVFEPTFIRNLSVTLDYYNIQVDNAIDVLGESVILSSCYPSAGGVTPQYCDLITRDPISGRITSISNLNRNVGGTDAAGIDLALRYALPTEVGRFGFVFDGTWLQKLDKTLADGTVIDGKGTFDLNDGGTFGVYPEFKFNAGVNWAWQGFGAGVQTRFLSGFKECGEPYEYDDAGTMSADFSGTGLCYQDSTFSRRVKAYSTYDVFLSYALKSGFGRTSVAVGINNVFDEEPSAIYNGFTAASDPTAYDFVGRFMYIRLGHNF
jgi:iron complex outermembrane recepter protein